MKVLKILMIAVLIFGGTFIGTAIAQDRGQAPLPAEEDIPSEPQHVEPSLPPNPPSSNTDTPAFSSGGLLKKKSGEAKKGLSYARLHTQGSLYFDANAIDESTSSIESNTFAVSMEATWDLKEQAPENDDLVHLFGPNGLCTVSTTHDKVAKRSGQDPSSQGVNCLGGVEVILAPTQSTRLSMKGRFGFGWNTIDGFRGMKLNGEVSYALDTASTSSNKTHPRDVRGRWTGTVLVDSTVGKKDSTSIYVQGKAKYAFFDDRSLSVAVRGTQLFFETPVGNFKGMDLGGELCYRGDDDSIHRQLGFEACAYVAKGIDTRELSAGGKIALIQY